MPRKSKPSTDKEQPPKAVGLFDHVNHIRKVQSERYYDQLSESDRKSFNHFMILKFLSMDRNSIEYIAEIAKYFEVTPSPNFYQLCVAVTARTNNFYPYVKSKSKKLNKELVQYVAKKFEVSTTESTDYCKLLLKTESGVIELTNICKGYGLTDKEVDKIIGYE